jgi:hypothetical protein
MARVEVLTDVPDSDVNRIVKEFEEDGAQVAKTRQGNNWTITATFPDTQD